MRNNDIWNFSAPFNPAAPLDTDIGDGDGGSGGGGDTGTIIYVNGEIVE